VRPAATAAALAAVAAATLLAGAPGAPAADVAVELACFQTGQQMTVTGSSFTPGTPVAITGDVTGSAQADALGRWSTQVVVPAVRGVEPVRRELAAIDVANPANVARVSFLAVRRAYDSNVPVRGRPADHTTWRFAGFIPDRPIFGHFRLRGRPMGDIRFGRARGTCGALTVRARRLPVHRIVGGRWTLKLDQRRRYSPGEPGATYRFRVSRTDRRR
jgi:hypothetical protein